MKTDRFEIRHEHYYCADYEWSVVGVSNVSFSDDGAAIVVTWHDGRVERRALPNH